MNDAQPSNAAPSVEVLSRGDGYLFASWRNVMIAIWSAQGTRPRVDALAAASARFAPGHPEGFSSLHVIPEGLPLATPEARQGLSDLLKRYADSLAAVGTVLEGSGFWASATRSLIVGLQLVVPSRFPMRTCSSLSELLDWLPEHHASRTGVTLDVQALERAIAYARTL